MENGLLRHADSQQLLAADGEGHIFGTRKTRKETDRRSEDNAWYAELRMGPIHSTLLCHVMTAAAASNALATTMVVIHQSATHATAATAENGASVALLWCLLLEDIAHPIRAPSGAAGNGVGGREGISEPDRPNRPSECWC